MKKYSIPFKINELEISLSVIAETEQKAYENVNKFSHVYLKPHYSYLFSAYQTLDNSVFHYFSDPKKNHENLLANYGITISQNDAIDIIEEINKINSKIVSEGGTRKTKIRYIFYPFIKIFIDIRYLLKDTKSIMKLLKENQNATKNLILENQDNTADSISSLNSSSDIIASRIISILALNIPLVIMISLLLLNTGAIIKIFTCSMIFILMSLNIVHIITLFRKKNGKE